MVVAIVLHGEPPITIPLGFTWNTALERLGLTNRQSENLLGEMRKLLSDQLPGDTLKKKFAGILSSAPPWLLSFCMCNVDATILEIRFEPKGPLPEPGRKEIECPSWPRLPQGAFGDGRSRRGT